MKKIQKIFALVLTLTIVLSFASCKNDEEIKIAETVPTTEATTEEPTTVPDETETTTEEETTEETTTKAKDKDKNTNKNTNKNSGNKVTTTRKQTTVTTTKKNTTTTTTKKDVTTDPTTNPTTPAPSNALVGKWSVVSQITISDLFEGEQLPGSYPTPLKLKTTCTFKNDGTFSIVGSVLNYNEFNMELRRVYVDLGKAECASEGVEFTDEMRAELEAEADAEMVQLNNDIKSDAVYGKYSVDGNKIYYPEDGTYETFTINGNTLTITGSSEAGSEEYYPVVLYREA